MRCLSRGSFKQAQTPSCPPTRRTEPPVQSYCCSHSLPDRQVHKFTPCSVSPTASLHTCDCRGSLYQLHILPATVCREGERKVEKKRAGWNIFQGSCHFLSDQPGAVGLQIKSVPKKKRRQQNTAEQSRQETLHSSLHQEKSHPRAKPATFLGPLTLFRVSLCLGRLCCGISK